jgi:hypothetical protein
MRHMKSDQATAASDFRFLYGDGRLPHNGHRTPLLAFR